VTAHYPLWRDLLDEHQQATLDPGLPDRLPRTPDVLVVGGGMVGVATAVACQRAGLGTISLVERSTLGGGATSGAGGLLVPEAHDDSDGVGGGDHDGDGDGGRGTGSQPDRARIVDLGRQSLALWRDLDDLVPGGVGLVDMDWLALEPRPGLSADLPPGAEALGGDDVARLVPELARPVAGVLVRDQGRLNPLGALAGLAGGLGHVATGVGVTGVRTSGGRVVRVSTTVGSVSPGAVVFATGGPPDAEDLALSVPASLVKGHIIATEPIPLDLPVGAPPLMTQVDDGRLLAGGTLDTGDHSPDVDDRVVAGIRRDLEAAFPAVGQVPISHAWCCFRPAHPDELPVVDRVPRLANAWMTSGHFRTGILMAPATGRALARWIESGERPAEAGGLELARFG
jgi:glycine/D-amino acid oxidase-like deaminating enzyme